MARFESNRERREKQEKFQSFNRPKLKIARTSADETVYIDYKDTESLRKMISGNGKIQARKRTSANAMEQRMIARAVKRARFLARAATANWDAVQGQRWTVPVGGGISRTLIFDKQPMTLGFQYYYNAKRPDNANATTLRFVLALIYPQRPH